MAKVTLLAFTPEPEKTVAAAAKLCYSPASIDTVLEGLTEEKTASFVQMLPKSGMKALSNTQASPLVWKVFPDLFWRKSRVTALLPSAFKARDMWQNMHLSMSFRRDRLHPGSQKGISGSHGGRPAPL